MEFGILSVSNLPFEEDRTMPGLNPKFKKMQKMFVETSVFQTDFHHSFPPCHSLICFEIVILWGQGLDSVVSLFYHLSL